MFVKKTKLKKLKFNLCFGSKTLYSTDVLKSDVDSTQNDYGNKTCIEKVYL